MSVRWLLALALIIGLVILALDLSDGARKRAAARRAPSVADVVTGRAEDPSLPQAHEADDTPPATSPAMTY
jgi:hypothetical protein